MKKTISIIISAIVFSNCNYIFAESNSKIQNTQAVSDTDIKNLFDNKNNRVIVDRISWEYSIIDENGFNIANISSNSIGGSLYIFQQGNKQGVIDSEGNIIVPAYEADFIGKVVDGLFTIKKNDEYTVYNTKGEIVKVIEKPLGFSEVWYESVVKHISGTNIVIEPAPGPEVSCMNIDMYTPEKDCFIIRLMSEKKAAENFFSIRPVSNGEFTAVGCDDKKAYFLNKDGSVRLKTNYVYLNPYNENIFVAHLDNGDYIFADRNGNPIAVTDEEKQRIENNTYIRIKQRLSPFDKRLSFQYNKNYHIYEDCYGKKYLTDENGNCIKKLDDDVGGSATGKNKLFSFTENGKVGIIDIDGNIIINPKFTVAGTLVYELGSNYITMYDGDNYRFNIYHSSGEFVKSFQAPIGGLGVEYGKSGKTYDIDKISGTSVILKEHMSSSLTESSAIEQDWFIFRLMSEEKVADNYFKITALPDGRFTAVNRDSLTADILYDEGNPWIKTKYKDLYYIDEDHFAGFNKLILSENDKNSEKYVLLDYYGKEIPTDLLPESLPMF